jgi:hypothetical protein
VPWQERFSDWESRGIKIIPVLSRPDDQWTGERGYVQVLLSFLAFGFFLAHLFPCILMYFLFFQNAFSRTKKVVNPSSMGAILCGHKQMTEVCLAFLCSHF